MFQNISLLRPYHKNLNLFRRQKLKKKELRILKNLIYSVSKSQFVRKKI